MFEAILADGRDGQVDETSEGAFVRWLREAMARRSLGIRQLATYAGVSRSTLSQILRGESTPEVETVRKLAEFFHADASELIGLAYGTKAAAPDLLTSDLDISFDWKQLTEEQQEAVRAIIKHFLATGGKS